MTRAPITEADPTVQQMEARVARFASLRPTDAYVDAAIPGCERTTYRVIGDATQAPLAAEHFHMNVVRCPPGHAAPLHNHLTQEVFVPQSGRWEVFWGRKASASSCSSRGTRSRSRPASRVDFATSDRRMPT